MVLRIGLGDFAEGDVARLEGFLQPLDRAIGVGIDGVVDLHLKNQVGSALQIEPQMDALLQRCQQPLPRQAAGNAEDAEQKDDQHRNNQNCLGEKILVHEKLQPVKTWATLRGRQRDDRGTRALRS